MRPAPQGPTTPLALLPIIMGLKPARKKVKKIRRIRKRSKQPGVLDDSMKWIVEDPHDEMFSRFVLDGGGQRLGESIGLDGRYLIVKSKMKFYKIPLENIADEGDELRIIRRVDMDKARKMGEQWKRENL